MQVWGNAARIAAEQIRPQVEQAAVSVKDLAMALHQKEQEALSHALHELRDPNSPVDEVVIKRGILGVKSSKPEPPNRRSILINDTRIDINGQVGIKFATYKGERFYHVFPGSQADGLTWTLPRGEVLPRLGVPMQEGESIQLPNGHEYELVARAPETKG